MIERLKITPRIMRVLLNCYPPYFGTGIVVDHISHDWRQIKVSMSLRWYSRNIAGTHFGGSLYAMVDPHLMLMLMRLLGDAYRVWDKAAEIEFIKATSKRVAAVFSISDDDLETIISNTADGKKYFAAFCLNITEPDNSLVARVKKVIYIRKNREILRHP